ncbi:protein dopey-2 [Clupea harengus]|uniref:Protein dopey-2 n=1 Tax=Clupea harengus TaxID=7950 RepID=A0A6P8GNB2_CLUHA|nr:protein dopey-2 [Clupea harengus]
MDPEEAELLNDYRYRSYAAVIEKALRNFESSSEWADLISSLGKLNKALQSNLKYSLLPRRLIIGKRLAQCLHPALPSGVHLKALETYEIIFKIIGTKWLARDLFIYSSGLFPLLSHAPMAVKPVLLGLYERYFLPLQRALLPSLQAFVMGLLPGLEEGLEVYDRTDALLCRLGVLVGQRVLYGALWGSLLVCPLVRLPATHFIVSHFDRMAAPRLQRDMLGTDHRLVVKSTCLSLQDSNVLVQRNMLEILLYFFPFATCLDPAEGAIPLSREDMITVVSAAALTLLRRDMSLNRRLYAWILGTDIKGGMVAPDPSQSTTLEEHTAFYFNTHSRELLVEALVSILKQKDCESDPENVLEYLKPFRVLISLLDKPEIGPVLVSDVLLEVVRAFHCYCKETLGEESLNSSTSSHHITSKMKENKITSEIIKTANMLFSSVSPDYLWDYLTKRFHTCLSSSASVAESKSWSSPPSVAELSTLIIFLLDVIPLELDSDIQTHFLPQMLSSMLHSLRSHMTALSQSELTHALQVCFKVLSKIQIPMAFMDMEAEAQTQLEEDAPDQGGKKNREGKEAGYSQADSNHGNGPAEQVVVVMNGDGGQEAGPGEAVFPPLRSEDSGLGLSASPSEQHILPGRDWSDPAMGVCPEREDVWRKGGSVESITHSVQEILAAVINRYLLCVVDDDQGKAAAAGQPDQGAPSPGRKGSSPGRHRGGSRDLVHISMPQIKDRLAEIFTPHSRLVRRTPSTESDGAGAGQGRSQGRSWVSGYTPRSRSEVTEAGRQAFTAACHLMLESTTFPLYLSQEENTHLYEHMFNSTGTEKGTLPEWLRALMALCCLSKDYQVQHVAISSLLELINHSQTLALVVKDKTRRARAAGASLQKNGHLQMVTVPPVPPTTLRAVEQRTDFYQSVAQVLWCQLDSERREHHLTCVELFYRLHCLAPAPAVCEDIICSGLLHSDKTVRLESLHRFSVVWHLTREMQFSMSLSLHRSFDRCLFVVLDSLNSEDSSIIAAGESWLLRALSLGDALRILEPVLLLLLDPRTQRMSIQNVKQDLTIGNLKVLSNRERPSSHHSPGLHGDATATKGQSEQSVLSTLISVDRQALWEELNRDPEQEQPSDWPALSRSGSEETSEEDDGAKEEDREEEEESEHTESADTSGAQVSTETNSSSTSGSGSAPYLQRHDDHEDNAGAAGGTNGVRRVDSARTQASDSLSSEEEAEQEELEAMARTRQLRRQREKRQAADSLFQHALLYAGAHDHARLLRALGMLGALLGPAGGVRGAALVEALGCTALEYSGHLSLLQDLLLRHKQHQEGGSFYGPILTARSPTTSQPAPSSPTSSSSSLPSSSSAAPSVLLELLVSLCLSFMRSHYPSYAGVGPRHLHGNRAVQVRSAEVLTRLAGELVAMASAARAAPEKGEERGRGVCRLLADCKVQEYVLLSLCASMRSCQRAHAHTHGHTHTHSGAHTHAGAAAAADALLLDPEEGGEVSEEGLVDVGRLSEAAAHERPLQVALLRLLRVLIVLEHHVWPSNPRAHPVAGDNHSNQHHHHHPPSAAAAASSSQHAPGSTLAREWQTAVLYQQSIRALQYVQNQPLTAQGMFVSAAGRALQPQHGHSLHPAWVELLGAALPFLGRSLGLIAAPLLSQMCRNLDELVRLHEHDGVKNTQSSSLKKENIAPDYPLTLLEGLTDITHYCLLESKKSSQGSDAADIRNARNAVLEEFPHMLSSMALLWGVVKGEEFQRRGTDSTHFSCHSATSVYFKNTKVLRQKVLDFLMPLTALYGVQLMASVAAVWSSRKTRKRHNKNKILPEASDSRLTIVHLVKSLSSLRTDTILQLVKEVVKKPHQIKGDQKSILVDIPMLQFSYAFIQSLPAQSLHDNVVPLLTLLRESAQLNLAPPGHFLLLGILNDFVNRLPNIDNKRDTRELQEVTQRILEAVGGVAGSSLEQTSWLSRNLEVKAQPQICLQEEDDDPEDSDLYDSVGQASTMVSSSAPSVYSVQALALLAEILAPLLDMVYRSDEKDKAVPLISRLTYYVFPYLKNHSAYNMPSFRAGAQLLSSLSGYAYTKRAWKKEVLDLYMDPLFFHMDPSCACHWRAIIDHLLTHEKTMFKDLMSMQSSSLKLFPSPEQKPMLLKRQAFAMFSGELDQYHLYLPLIQERLTENLRLGQTPSVAAQMFLMFRVLLLRISPQHLTSLWPIMVTELIRSFVRLEKALMEDKESSKSKSRGAQEKNSVLMFPQSELDMYLSACKFLDMAISFPPERMPLFQMYRWAFVPEVDIDSYSGPDNNLLEGEPECKPHISRVLEGLQRRYGELNGVVGESCTERLEFPLLTLRSLTSITQLHPFLHTVSCSFSGRPGDDPWPVAEYPARSSEGVLRRLEHISEGEFLSNMEG